MGRVRTSQHRVSSLWISCSLLLLSSICSESTLYASDAITPCPDIEIQEASDLDLTDAEIRLLCGDPLEERVGIAWKSIPPVQAKTNFTNFMQDRGHFNPVFEAKGETGVIMKPGPTTFITTIRGENLPAGPHRIPMDPSLGRALPGLPLTPKRVGEARAWLKRRLEENGYACPEIEAWGNPETGAITLTWINRGDTAHVKQVKEDQDSGAHPSLLRRYDAFKVGGPYSRVTNEISVRRSGQSKRVASSDLAPECPIQPETPTPSEVLLEERVQAGPPRRIALGGSVNSEVGPEAYFSWSYTRIGTLGSLAELSLRGSLKEQRARALYEWQIADSPSRDRIVPAIDFAHRNERRYELIELRGGGLFKTGGEWETHTWSIGAGPRMQNLQQVRGLGPANSQFLTFETELELGSHLFEYYAAEPQTGFQSRLEYRGVASTIPGVGRPQGFAAEATGFLSIGKVDPPWVILGGRARAFSTAIAEGVSTGDVPVDFRDWIGGFNDLRGFGREELPGNDYGARDGLILGTEARVPGILPLGIQPLVLFDAAWLRNGASVGTEKTELFWNAGFGLRWASPVGAIRTSLAHGYKVGSPNDSTSHLQFLISLGEEF